MSNRLSYSQIKTYTDCGVKYKNHYVLRLRSKFKSGALYFGSAIDKAVEAVLLDPNVNELAVFNEWWLHQEHNKVRTYLPDCTFITYAQSDMDWDILDHNDRSFLKAKKREWGFDPADTIETTYAVCLMAKKTKNYKTYTVEQNKFLNLCNWTSLRQKGILMLKAHRKHILPKITKVVSTQTPIELSNGDDIVMGFADLVCHYLDDPEPMIFDYKTSTIEYEPDSAKTSAQLAIYSHALGIKKVGFIVFRKGIKKNRTKICSVCGHDGSESRAKTCDRLNENLEGKRCSGVWTETIRPEVDIQIITDKVSPEMETIVIENADAVNRAIAAGIYTRNLESCQMPWGRCDFYNLCHNNSKEGLEQM